MTRIKKWIFAGSEKDIGIRVNQYFSASSAFCFFCFVNQGIVQDYYEKNIAGQKGVGKTAPQCRTAKSTSIGYFFRHSSRQQHFI